MATSINADEQHQVLDVGDIARYGEHEGVIARISGERHVLVVAGCGQIGGLRRSDLTRVGGDMQIGDWVLVQGNCLQSNCVDYSVLDNQLGLIVDDYPEMEGDASQSGPDFLVFVQGEGQAYSCLTSQLTRVSRAEALA
ncbi:hypothetical protein GO986_18570 [Deinococcus sp. HMF7620]|uniref:Uncharacterized protein n=1 Tax=Deinococcus arboris TaxID=2682977 RepID=A0A7C9IE26_9DEIO|nr:hypothetical protein [Deinococcus arboris]MVN88746.1 hypothetical protein [Deinococcus arboris]